MLLLLLIAAFVLDALNSYLKLCGRRPVAQGYRPRWGCLWHSWILGVLRQSSRSHYWSDWVCSCMAFTFLVFLQGLAADWFHGSRGRLEPVFLNVHLTLSLCSLADHNNSHFFEKGLQDKTFWF